MSNNLQPQGIELVELLVDRSTQGAVKARKKKSSSTNIYDRLENPGLFEYWWGIYRDASNELGRPCGGKGNAAKVWSNLERREIDLELIVEATEWDINDRLTKKRAGKFATWLPNGDHYLSGGYWETAIESKWRSEALAEEQPEAELTLVDDPEPIDVAGWIAKFPSGVTLSIRVGDGEYRVGWKVDMLYFHGSYTSLNEGLKLAWEAYQDTFMRAGDRQ